MDDIFDGRIGRLVSLGRAALATGSLAAVWIDPAERGTAAHLLLAGYAGFALTVSLLQMTHLLRQPIWGLAAHLVDLVVFTILLYLTDGPSSPFFPLLVFALLVAMLRWQWRGVLRTTAALLALYVVMGLVVRPESLAAPAGMQQFIVRALQLGVVGCVLTAFGYYQGRLSRDVMRINMTTPDPTEGEAVPIETSLRYAAYIYKARRVILAWSDGNEPWLYLSEWRDEQLHQSVVPPNRFDPIVAARSDRPFVYRQGRAALLGDDHGRLIRSDETRIDPAFLEHFGIRHAIVLPVVASGIEGWMFIVVDRAFPPEALAMAMVLDAQIAAIFNKAAARAATIRAGASEQRLRLARDLHDGILQFLAGLAMQVQSVIKSQDVDAAWLERLRALQDALIVEQREVRMLIRRLRPGASEQRLGERQLGPDLAALVDRLQRQWRARISLSVEPPDLSFPLALHHDIHQMTREAVANAVRHGGSRRIDINANREDGVLRLTISDDGSGLALHGTFDADQLAERNIGPRSLRERVSTLGGTIAVTSSSLGTSVKLAVPLHNHGGHAP